MYSKDNFLDTMTPLFSNDNDSNYEFLGFTDDLTDIYGKLPLKGSNHAAQLHSSVEEILCDITSSNNQNNQTILPKLNHKHESLRLVDEKKIRELQNALDEVVMFFKARRILEDDCIDPFKENGIKSEFPKFGTTVKNEFPKMETTVKYEFPKIETTVKYEFPKIETTVKNEFPKMETTVKNEFPKFGTTVKNEFPKFGTTVKNEFPKFGTTVKNEFPKMETTVKNEFPKMETTDLSSEDKKSTRIIGPNIDNEDLYRYKGLQYEMSKVISHWLTTGQVFYNSTSKTEQNRKSSNNTNGFSRNLDENNSECGDAYYCSLPLPFDPTDVPKGTMANIFRNDMVTAVSKFEDSSFDDCYSWYMGLAKSSHGAHS